MGLNVFDRFQTLAIIILIEVQIVLPLASGSVFNLVLETFGHTPTQLFFFGHAMQHVGSYFPNQGSNLCPLQWKRGVLTTELPGKSPYSSLIPSLPFSNEVVLFFHPSLTSL